MSQDSPARKRRVEEVKLVVKNDVIPNRAESPVKGAGLHPCILSFHGSPQLRLPHLSRFSTGGYLRRWRRGRLLKPIIVLRTYKASMVTTEQGFKLRGAHSSKITTSGAASVVETGITCEPSPLYRGPDFTESSLPFGESMGTNLPSHAGQGCIRFAANTKFNGHARYVQPARLRPTPLKLCPAIRTDVRWLVRAVIAPNGVRADDEQRNNYKNDKQSHAAKRYLL